MTTEETMDLQTFIREALVQIMTGLKEAQDHLKDSHARICPVFKPHWDRQDAIGEGEGNRPVRCIEFDVALTVQANKENKGKAGVSVWSIGLGTERGKTEGSSTVSRVKFQVPVMLL